MAAMCDILHVVGEPVSHRRVSVLLGYLYSRSGMGMQSSKLVTRFIVVEPVAVDGFLGGDWSPDLTSRRLTEWVQKGVEMERLRSEGLGGLTSVWTEIFDMGDSRMM